jgi:histidinol-phosphate phosphatase family protein
MDKRPAIFLDRDGTIIEDANYPKYPEQVHFLSDVEIVLSIFQKKGFLLILISNQSGIGRGLITMEEANNVHHRVLSILNNKGVCLDASYYCIHGPEENCSCRKPSPEMILRAAEELNVDLSNSFMIGDREVDMETGKNAGCRTILIKSGQETGISVLADYTADNWQDVLRHVIETSGL